LDAAQFAAVIDRSCRVIETDDVIASFFHVLFRKTMEEKAELRPTLSERRAGFACKP